MAIFSAITAFIGSISAWIGSLGVIGTAVLKVFVGIGLNKLAVKLAGKKASGPTFSVKGQLQRGADIPQSFLVGQSATAGSLTFVNTWGRAGGTPNAYLTMVISLSDMPVQALAGLWVNGEKVALDGAVHADYGVAVSKFNKGGTDHFWVKFYDGTQTAVDSFLTDTVSDDDRLWDAEAVGYGTAYVVVTVLINQKLFNGFPQCLFEVTGVPLYDPSRDSSVGGVGVQRWADPSTWGGDGDGLPAVAIYNLLRGIWFQGQWFYGMQVTTVAQLPAVHWIAQINKCRATIASGDGPEPKFRAGGEISVGAQIVEAVEAFLDACQGRLSEAGGIYKLFVGAPDAAVATFSDDDILSSEEQTFTPFFGLADTVNGISAKFPDPEQGWQTETAPPLNRSDLEAEDGSRRLMVDVQFDLVPYAEQVQRLMLASLNEARRARRHTFTLPPSFWALEPGDVVSWTSVRNGYDAKLFRVDGVLDQPNADVVVDLTEIDSTDYDFNTLVDFTPPVRGSIIGSAIAPQVITGWAVQPWSIKDAADAPRMPAILVSWSSDVDDIAAVRVQLRLKATAALVFTGRFDGVSDGQGILAQGILPGVEYQVRGIFVPASPRDVEWSDWLDVIAPDLRLRPEDMSVAVWDQIANDATDQAEAVLQDFRTTEFTPAIEQNLTEIVRLDAVNAVASRSLTRSESELERLAEAATAALLRQGLAETRMYDAGMRVDADTGEVTIEGIARHDGQLITVEQRLQAAEGLLILSATMVEVNQAIATAQLTPVDLAALDDVWVQINLVEQTIDAINASLTQTASVATTDALSQQLTQAQTQLDALAGEVETLVTNAEFGALQTVLTGIQETLSVLDVPSITRTVFDLYLHGDQVDALAEQAMLGMLDGYNADVAGQQKLAIARDELTADITAANEAIAQAKLLLGAEIDGVAAQVQTEATARSDGDTANASQITALTAVVTGQGVDLVDVAAQVLAEATARADGDTANASQITALTAVVIGQGVDLVDVAAQVQTETTARADGDTANAGQITALTATVGDQSTTIIQQSEAIADLGGSIQYSIDVNGHIAGWAFSNQVDPDNPELTPYAMVTFLADRFQISSPDGSYSPFVAYAQDTLVGGVTIPAGSYLADAFIANASIGTANIQDGAVTNKFAAFAASAFALTSSFQSVQELDIDCDGHPISILANIGLNGASSVEFDIRVDGVSQRIFRASAGIFMQPFDITSTMTASGHATGSVSVSGSGNGSFSGSSYVGPDGGLVNISGSVTTSVTASGSVSAPVSVTGSVFTQVVTQPVFYENMITLAMIANPTVGSKAVSVHARVYGGDTASPQVRNIFLETTENKR